MDNVIESETETPKKVEEKKVLRHVEEIVESRIGKGEQVQWDNAVSTYRHVLCGDDYLEHWMGGYGNPKDTSYMWDFKKLHLRFNPIVMFISIITIWGFIVWCIVDEDVPFVEWTTWITDKWTWLYVGSQDAWALFMIVIYFSKYGNMKLGKPNEQPEFSSMSWFTMLFACGVGVGLFFFGLAEPIYHYDANAGGGNRYSTDRTIPDNTLAQIAINITYFHWGIHGWIVYSLIGLLLGIIAYREDLPMTMKSCFYPLIGDLIFTWLGDVIDILSIITTMFGVCTSLGLGARQLNSGMNIIFDMDFSEDSQLIIIWCITAVATTSTLSGLQLGIRRLSEICFALGMVVMGIVFLLDDPFFVLNLLTQSIGFYLQWIIQLGFHCDTYEMLGPSSGAEDRGRFEPGDVSTDGPEDWMDWWTITYWGWWIAWSPFVGMFIAKISRGRTVRQFINGTLTAPILYTFTWIALFGGLGMKMERTSAGVGLCCNYNFNTTYLQEYINSTTDVTSTDLLNVTEISPWSCGSGVTCNQCSMNILNRYDGETTLDGFITGLGADANFVIRNDAKTLVRLSCTTKESMWFSLMGSYGDIGDFLQIFSILCIALYFITTSDSGSLIIDILSANGDPDPPRLQRVFWALTEGAAASALLKIGGIDSLEALQSMNIATGLPYTIVLCFTMVALWRSFKVSSHEVDPNGPAFKVGCMDVLISTDTDPWARLLVNFFIAPWTLGKATAKLTHSRNKPWVVFIFSEICFVAFIICHVLNVWIEGMWSVAWIFYCTFCIVTAAVRTATRNRFNMDEGSPIEDLIIAFFYPFAAFQLEQQLDLEYPPEKSEKVKEEERQLRTLNMIIRGYKHYLVASNGDTMVVGHISKKH